MNVCAKPGCSLPRFVEYRTNIEHDYCGRTHAEECLGPIPPPHGICHTCSLKGCTKPVHFDSPTSRVHDFCCKDHAERAMTRNQWPTPVRNFVSNSSQQCSLDGCRLARFRDPQTGQLHDYCGRSHAIEAKEHKSKKARWSSSAPPPRVPSKQVAVAAPTPTASSSSTASPNISSGDIIRVATAYGYSLRRSIASNTIFLRKTQQLAGGSQDILINIYYTTRGVMTRIDHPARGVNDLWRSCAYATLAELEAILQNPRLHTGRGYRSAENAIRGCVGCGEFKSRVSFSPSQWSKGVQLQRCIQCVDQDRAGSSSSSSGVCVLSSSAAPAAPSATAALPDQPVRQMDVPMCVVCMEHNADTILLPCAHVCLCHCDAQKWEARCQQEQLSGRGVMLCPLCQQPVSKFQRVPGF